MPLSRRDAIFAIFAAVRSLSLTRHTPARYADDIDAEAIFRH
jgi:hypothetical protein